MKALQLFEKGMNVNMGWHAVGEQITTKPTELLERVIVIPQHGNIIEAIGFLTDFTDEYTWTVNTKTPKDYISQNNLTKFPMLYKYGGIIATNLKLIDSQDIKIDRIRVCSESTKNLRVDSIVSFSTSEVKETRKTEEPYYIFLGRIEKIEFREEDAWDWKDKLQIKIFKRIEISEETGYLPYSETIELERQQVKGTDIYEVSILCPCCNQTA